MISLKDFLIKYTAVSEKFINEYYRFYELCEKNKFGISIEYVANYLGIKDISDFCERLKDNYILREDYIIVKLKRKLEKNVKNTFYFLSFDGFEKVCMQSKTKKGKEVRDYFILLRKFIDYYKDHFSQKIIDLTKNNKYVYILLVNKDKDIFKVGRTNDIRKRLYSYSTGRDKHPDIKFIMIIEDPKLIEKCTNIFLKQHNYKNKKELYKIDFDLLKKIVFKCAEIKKGLEDSFKSFKSGKFNEDDHDAYIVYNEVDHVDQNDNVIGYEKEMRIKKMDYKSNNIKKSKSKVRSKTKSKSKK